MATDTPMIARMIAAAVADALAKQQMETTRDLGHLTAERPVSPLPSDAAPVVTPKKMGRPRLESPVRSHAATLPRCESPMCAAENRPEEESGQGEEVHEDFAH